MIGSLVDIIDKFLFDNIDNVFKKTEDRYEAKGLSVDIYQELKNFESNPLTCVVACDTKFEANIKLQLKFTLGIFFVAIPLFTLSLLTYIIGFEYSYAFMGTFMIAMLTTCRLDEIAKRYVSKRLLRNQN